MKTVTHQAGVAVGFAAIVGLSATLNLTAPRSATAAERNADLARRRTPVVEAYERARDSVVNIAAVEQAQIHRIGFWGDIFRFPTERRSVGSGVILHEEGYIATNAHVVAAATELKVILADGREYPARLIGRDSSVDLAVIKIDPKERLTPIVMGRSDDLMIGEPTIAVGNPVGLNNTVTTGVISALHRELEIAGRLIYRDVIQTDASINPGNSGGPLLNILGELIGVNTAVRTDAQNIGFAIPVEQLRRILPDVLDSEKHNKVLVGMVVSETQPPKVVEVRADGPAAAAGVKTGDVVTAIDGQPVQRGVDFYVHVLGRKAGEKLRLGLVRDGVSRDASLTLLSMPKPDGRRLARERLGLTVADVGEQASRRFPWTRERGVLVLAVEPRSAADQADLRPGDLVISLARHAVTDVDHFGALLTNVPAGDAADIGVLREHRGMIYYLEERIHVR